MAGKFITLEGVDGSGKSTLMQGLNQHLHNRGVELLILREPGSTALGEQLRPILKQSVDQPLTPETEMLLFFAARMQLCAECIEPALSAGHWVLSDRYLDSTYAYQVAAGGASGELFERIVQGLGLPLPDLTLLLDMDPSASLARADHRPVEFASADDDFETRGKNFLIDVRRGYLDLAERHPERIKVLAANQPPELVQAEASALLDSLLQEWLRASDS